MIGEPDTVAAYRAYVLRVAMYRAGCLRLSAGELPEVRALIDDLPDWAGNTTEEDDR